MDRPVSAGSLIGDAMMRDRYVAAMDKLYLACVFLCCASVVAMTVLIAAGVFSRGAPLSPEYPHGAWMAAAFTLAVSVVLQTLAMGVYLAVTEPRTLRDVVVHWRWSLVVGLSGVLASIAWFTAFTLQNAAYVRALGQIELLFTFFISVVVFREKTTRIEIFGILLVAAAILLLLLGR